MAAETKKQRTGDRRAEENIKGTNCLIQVKRNFGQEMFTDYKNETYTGHKGRKSFSVL